MNSWFRLIVLIVFFGLIVMTMQTLSQKGLSPTATAVLAVNDPKNPELTVEEMVQKEKELRQELISLCDPSNLLIERLALGPHLHKGMNRLSGGMKRRFMVAKALIHKPRLLILDEPTAGVDVELRRTLWDFVREMNRAGTTVLLTTHYLEEAEEMCERIAIMNHGKIIAMETTKEMIRKIDEKSLVVELQAPLASMPDILQKFSCELQNNGRSLHFQITKNTSTAEILQGLASAKLKSRELETKKSNLQQVFLKLTGDSHDAKI